jgi:hypothetical protein
VPTALSLKPFILKDGRSATVIVFIRSVQRMHTESIPSCCGCLSIVIT